MNVDLLRQSLVANLARVDNLLAIYQAVQPSGSGRAGVDAQDLLRASVVFSHASLESLARSLLEARMRFAPGDRLAGLLTFPLPNNPGKRKDTVTAALLLHHRGAQVDAIVNEALEYYLDHFNLNHPEDLVNALSNCGIQNTAALQGGRRAIVEAMMRRRHWIVHQLDRARSLGRGHFLAESISPETAGQYRAVVQQLGELILDEAEKLP